MIKVNEFWIGPYATYWNRPKSEQFVPTTVPPIGYIEPKADPTRSTLDRLAEVLHTAYNGEHSRKWDGMSELYQRRRRVEAHAVRMAVLREEPSDKELRAASIAFRVAIGGFIPSLNAALADARQARIDAAEKEMKDKS